MKPFTLCYCLLVVTLSSAVVRGFYSGSHATVDETAIYELATEAEEPRHLQGVTHEDFLVSLVPGQMPADER
jgi:hypothetical protein